jgi:hypothetical protein
MSTKTSKIFFRVGNLDTNIEEVEYKSLIMDLFDKYAGVQLDDGQIRLVTNKDYGGFQRFSFVTLGDEDDLNAVVSSFEGIVTDDGYDLVANEAQDKPKPAGNGGFRGDRGSSRDYNNNNRDRGNRRY